MISTICRCMRLGSPFQDNYLDAYLRVIKNTDPLRSSLVFSCGMGAVRTTFAMIAALIVRRKMIMLRGFEDPYAIKPSRPSAGSSGYNTVSGISSNATYIIASSL